MGDVHDVLDMVGLLPGLGEPADLINAGLYGLQGDKLNAGLSLGAAVPFIGYAATGTKLTLRHTKSTLKLGQEMHTAYKVGEEGIKEFRLLSGKRIDFLDINNGIIYELKPFNPRSIKQGNKQLQMYLNELQSPEMLKKFPSLNGINWKTVLETY